MLCQSFVTVVALNFIPILDRHIREEQRAVRRCSRYTKRWDSPDSLGAWSQQRRNTISKTLSNTLRNTSASVITTMRASGYRANGWAQVRRDSDSPGKSAPKPASKMFASARRTPAASSSAHGLQAATPRIMSFPPPLKQSSLPRRAAHPDAAPEMTATVESIWETLASRLRSFIRPRVRDHAAAEDIL